MEDYEIIKRSFPNAKIFRSPGNDVDWIIVEPNDAVVLVKCDNFILPGISDTYYMIDVTNGLKSK